jgi:translation initiation factor 6 (eIF-6)
MLEKTIKIDKIEIIGIFKAVNIRQAIVISEDGVELSRSHHRNVLNCGVDISGEDAEVQAVCNAVWTDEVKAAYQTHLDNQNPIGE